MMIIIFWEMIIIALYILFSYVVDLDYVSLERNSIVFSIDHR
jgi:hypothetical protein